MIQNLYLILFFCLPLIFSSFNSELFELPKTYFLYSLTLLITLTHLLNFFRSQKPLFKKTSLNIIFFIFLFSQIISTVTSIDPHTSLFGYYSRLNGGLLSLISFFLLFTILPLYINRRFTQKIILASLISGFFVASYGILEHFGINDHLWVQDVRSRVFSTLGQPNWLAAYLAILIPLTLYQLHTSRSTLKKILYLLLIFIFYLCLLFTKSKSGIFAAVSSVSLFYILYFIRQKSKNLPILALIFTLFISLSLIINNPIKDFVFFTRQSSSVGGPQKLDINNSTLEIDNLNITPSGEIRQIVWQGAFDLWRQHPLFGTGTETFAYSYYWTRPQEHNLTSEWDFLYNKAHNEYLNFLATTGIFGLGSYLLLIFSTLVYFIKKIFIKNNRPLLNIALLCAYLSILITNAFGFSVIITSLYFFLLPIFSYPVSRSPTIQFSRPQKYISFTFIIIFALYFSQKILYYYLADITYNQALSADNRQQYLQAKSLINQSLGYRPNEPIYHSKAAFINAKIALENPDNSDYQNQSIRHLTLAAKISPFNTNIWKEQALTLFYLSTLDSKYFPLSITALENVTRLAPTDAKTYYLIGKYYQATQNYSQAITAYQKAIQLKSNYDHAYFSLAQIQFEQKDYAAAKINFENTLKYAPKNEQAKDYLKKLEKLLPQN